MQRKKDTTTLATPAETGRGALRSAEPGPAAGPALPGRASWGLAPRALRVGPPSAALPAASAVKPAALQLRCAARPQAHFADGEPTHSAVRGRRYQAVEPGFAPRVTDARRRSCPLLGLPTAGSPAPHPTRWWWGPASGEEGTRAALRRPGLRGTSRAAGGPGAERGGLESQCAPPGPGPAPRPLLGSPLPHPAWQRWLVNIHQHPRLAATAGVFPIRPQTLPWRSPL